MKQNELLMELQIKPNVKYNKIRFTYSDFYKTPEFYLKACTPFAVLFYSYPNLS